MKKSDEIIIEIYKFKENINNIFKKHFYNEKSDLIKNINENIEKINQNVILEINKLIDKINEIELKKKIKLNEIILYLKQYSSNTKVLYKTFDNNKINILNNNLNNMLNEIKNKIENINNNLNELHNKEIKLNNNNEIENSNQNSFNSITSNFNKIITLFNNNDKKIIKKTRNKSIHNININQNNKDYQSFNKSFNKSTINNEEINFDLFYLAKNFLNFIDDMKELQNSIVLKKENKNLLKINFEKRKIEIEQFCKQIVYSSNINIDKYDEILFENEKLKENNNNIKNQLKIILNKLTNKNINNEDNLFDNILLSIKQYNKDFNNIYIQLYDIYDLLDKKLIINKENKLKNIKTIYNLIEIIKKNLIIKLDYCNKLKNNLSNNTTSPDGSKLDSNGIRNFTITDIK